MASIIAHSAVDEAAYFKPILHGRIIAEPIGETGRNILGPVQVGAILPAQQPQWHQRRVPGRPPDLDT